MTFSETTHLFKPGYYCPDCKPVNVMAAHSQAGSPQPSKEENLKTGFWNLQGVNKLAKNRSRNFTLKESITLK